MNASDYSIGLVEAEWYITFRPQTACSRAYVSRLIEELTAYEKEHGLESHELRELKSLEDEQ